MKDTEIDSSSKEISRLKGDVEAGNRVITIISKGIERVTVERDALKAENASLRGALERIAYGEIDLVSKCDKAGLEDTVIEDMTLARDALSRSPSSFAEESKALSDEAIREPDYERDER